MKLFPFLVVIIMLFSCGEDAKKSTKKNPNPNNSQTNNNTNSNNSSSNNTTSGQTSNGTQSHNNTTTSATTGGTTHGSTTAVCNNGKLETSEECEGFELRNETCQSQGFSGGKLTCGNDCKLDNSACFQCGDGTINGPEETCDGTDFGTKTCDSELAGTSGDLTCTASCKIDTSGCLKPKTCRKILNCIYTSGCTASDNVCLDGCKDGGSTNALALYDGIVACATIHTCTDTNCITSHCGTEVQACMDDQP